MSLHFSLFCFTFHEVTTALCWYVGSVGCQSSWLMKSTITCWSWFDKVIIATSSPTFSFYEVWSACMYVCMHPPFRYASATSISKVTMKMIRWDQEDTRHRDIHTMPSFCMTSENVSFIYYMPSPTDTAEQYQDLWLQSPGANHRAAETPPRESAIIWQLCLNSKGIP